MLKRIMTATLLAGAIAMGAAAQSSPPAVQTASVRTSRVSRNLPRAVPLCEQAFEERGIAVWDMVASEDPADPQYRSDNILDTLPSDWRTNIDPAAWRNNEPLALKARELYDPRSTDIENIQRIADWVRNAKPYAPADLAGIRRTVQTVYNAPTGVCVEAAIMLTAMLRANGYPAEAVLSYDKTHAVSRVFAENRWMLVDATFALIPDLQAHARETGDESLLRYIEREFAPSGGLHALDNASWWPAYIWPEGGPFLAGYTEKQLGVCQGLSSPHSGRPLEEVIIFHTKAFANEQEGIPYGLTKNLITFPVTRRKAYYDPQTKEISLEAREGWYPTTINVDIVEVSDGCLGIAGLVQASPARVMAPFNTWWGTDPGTHMMIDADGNRGTGFITTVMPGTADRCLFKINYSFGSPDLAGPTYGDYESFASLTFALGITPVRLTITPDMLETCDECYKGNFEVLRSALRENPDPETLPVRR